MPHEPKRRHSKERQGQHRAAIVLKVAKAVTCPNCKEPMMPHTVCKHCGFYKGTQVTKVKSRATVTRG